MYIKLIVQKSFLFVCLFSSVSLFALEQLTFSPQITVNKNTTSGGGLSITADKMDFYAYYSSSIESFESLQIPFSVHSTDGTKKDYAIKLIISQHYCRAAEGENKPLNNVNVMVDGTNLSLPNGDEHDGLTVVGATESQHNMRVTFPKIQIKNEYQTCFGTFQLIAELGL